MPDLIDTVQDLSIDDSFIELYDITLPTYADQTATTVHLINGLSEGQNNIYFPSKDGTSLNEYIAIPISISGISMSSSGASNRPTLSLANIPSLTRSITNNEDGLDDETTLQDIKKDETERILESEGIYTNDDLLGSKITYRSTLKSNLYSQSDLAGWTTTLPVEFPSQTFIFDRVSAENAIFVEFELASPFDVEGVKIPNRQVNGRYCPWEYQGWSKSGKGGCNWPVNSNGRFFDEENNIITKDITTDLSAWNSQGYTKGDRVYVATFLNGDTYYRIYEAVRTHNVGVDPKQNGYYWKRIDVCGKLITSCKIRFQGNNLNIDLDTSKSLPFGGFPGARSFR